MDMMKRVWEDEPEYMDHPEISPWFDEECEGFFKLIPVESVEVKDEFAALRISIINQMERCKDKLDAVADMVDVLSEKGLLVAQRNLDAIESRATYLLIDPDDDKPKNGQYLCDNPNCRGGIGPHLTKECPWPVNPTGEDRPRAVDNGDGTGSLKGKLVGMGL